MPTKPPKTARKVVRKPKDPAFVPEIVSMTRYADFGDGGVMKWMSTVRVAPNQVAHVGGFRTKKLAEAWVAKALGAI